MKDRDLSKEILNHGSELNINFWLLVISLFILGLITLSVFIPHPKSIQCVGRLTTLAPFQKIINQSQSYRVIHSLLVQNGDSVSKGQTLAVLKSKADYEHVSELSKLWSLPSQDSYINFLLNFEKQKPVLGEITSSYNKVILDLMYVVRSKESSINVVTDERRNKLTSESNFRLNELIKQKSFLNNELRLKEKEVSRSKILFSKGVISQAEYERLLVNFSSFKRNLENIQLQISMERENNFNNFYNSRIVDVQENEKFDQLLSSFFSSLKVLKLEINKWNDEHLILSQIDGIVVFNRQLSTSDLLSPGEIFLEIIPMKQDILLANLNISTENIQKIKKGQEVYLSFLNDNSTMPARIKSHISNIYLGQNSDGFYRAEVAVTKGEIISEIKDFKFRKGIKIDAEIILHEQSLFTYIYSNMAKK